MIHSYLQIFIGELCFILSTYVYIREIIEEEETRKARNSHSYMYSINIQTEDEEDKEFIMIITARTTELLLKV